MSDQVIITETPSDKSPLIGRHIGIWNKFFDSKNNLVRYGIFSFFRWDTNFFFGGGGGGGADGHGIWLDKIKVCSDIVQ